jgi:hypothetical protein
MMVVHSFENLVHTNQAKNHHISEDWRKHSLSFKTVSNFILTMIYMTNLKRETYLFQHSKSEIRDAIDNCIL